MNTLPAISLPSSSPSHSPEHQKIGEFSVAARLLLDSLRESRTQLDTAIRLLTHFSEQPGPNVPQSYVEVAAKVRRVLAQSRRASEQSQATR